MIEATEGKSNGVSRAHASAAAIKLVEEPTAAAVDIRADYVAKNGAPSAAAPKIFFRYYLVDSNPGAFPPGTSPETFYKRPQSKPINKLISEVFFKSGLMEAWGRGIPDIFDLCKENGLPKPEFELANGYVYLTIRFAKPLTPRLSDDRENDKVNDKVNSLQLTDRQKKIISIIKRNDKVTAKEIKSHFEESIATINRDITILKKANILSREGSDKDGRWVVHI